MLSPRPEVLALSEVIHGALNHTELAALGIDPASVIDFSASVNPFGPSPRVIEAIANSQIHCYPDRDATEFRQALASHLGVPKDCLIAGNGSSELLYLIGLAFLRSADQVLVVGPTYSEYSRVAQLMGATVSCCQASPRSGFQFPTRSLEESIRALRPRAVFVCHPNNPTGQLTPTAAIYLWADEFPQTLFIIDEAYIEFSPDAQSFTKSIRDNIVVLRSMTKAHGLAGLRLGYAVSTPAVIDLLARVRPPWSVSTIAQNAGIAALQDSTYLQRALASLAAEKTLLEERLAALGAMTFPSETHFFLIRVANATATRQQLLNSGILVRDCTSFGMPGFLRISPQTPPQNTLFCEAWKQLPVGC
ncbi:MAG: histidinol-phosphate aminotransferase family protein [Planctomycetaceae bacterium]|nr:histidinol-phosphate aminotransferase family protein [Planctomycetaceae bacterium]